MNYKYFIRFLTLICVTVWLSFLTIDTNLHIIACDVGQGDAILIQRKTTQILIDGGPDKSVLDCLGRHMPVWDRTIELVILTHPQEDHYGGLIDVVKQYKINNIGEYNRHSSNVSYQVLENEVRGRDIDSITMTSGMVTRVGLIQLDILHPDSNENNSNVNDDGIVTLLRYGSFKAIFTADVENKVSDELSKIKEIENLDYIKVNHHGSKNGMSERLLSTVMPKVAVISLGRDNRYGHPNKEILEMLNKYDVKVLRTDELGDVEILVNGSGIIRY